MKRLSAVLLALVLILTGCSGGSSSTKGTQDELRVAVQADATSMDPSVFNDDYSDLAMRQVYETLVAKDKDGKIYNLLAESVEEKDEGKTYVIKIRKGVKFHSGKELTVEDVIFNLQRVIDNKKSSGTYKNIVKDSIKKLDDTTLEIKLEHPQGSFMEVLSSPYLGIVNKDSTVDLNQQEDGTGPFVLKEWNPNSIMKFERFEDYWGAKPAFKSMVFKIIPEATNRTIELESGGVDIALNIATTDIKRIEENKELALYRKTSPAVHFIEFNLAKAPFDKLEAREAISYAIDLEEIVNSVYMGVGQIATSPISPQAKYSIANEVTPIKRDVQKAKELLKKAGVKEGTVIDFYVNDNQQRQDVATIVQAQLKEVGLDVKIQKLEWGAYIEVLKNKDENMFMMSWSPSIVDPDQYLYSPFHSNKAGDGPNYGMYVNKDVDRLIEEGIMTIDSGKREEIYKEAQEIIMKDKPWIPVVYGELVYGASAKVKGFDMLGEYAQVFKTIEFEK